MRACVFFSASGGLVPRVSPLLKSVPPDQPRVHGQRRGLFHPTVAGVGSEGAGHVRLSLLRLPLSGEAGLPRRLQPQHHGGAAKLRGN